MDSSSIQKLAHEADKKQGRRCSLMDDLTKGAAGGEDPGTPGVREPSETSHTEHQPLMSEMQDEHHEASSPTVGLQSGWLATLTKDRRHMSYRTACMSWAHSRRICTGLVPEECREGRFFSDTSSLVANKSLYCFPS